MILSWGVATLLSTYAPKMMIPGTCVSLLICGIPLSAAPHR